MACLTEHQSQLSAECATSVKTRTEARAIRGTVSQLAQAQPAPGTGAPVPPAATPPVAAAPAAPMPGGRADLRACRTDLATLCADVTQGNGRKIKCLMEHQPKLSKECAVAVGQGQQTRQAAKIACAADAAKLCATQKGKDRTQCLAANKALLSADCAAVIGEREAQLVRRAKK